MGVFVVQKNMMIWNGMFFNIQTNIKNEMEAKA